MFGDQRIILVSRSARHLALAHQIGLEAEVIPSRFEEKLSKASFPTPAAYAMAVARGKACDVVDDNNDAVVIGAETVLVIGNEILEQPSEEDCAHHVI